MNFVIVGVIFSETSDPDSIQVFGPFPYKVAAEEFMIGLRNWDNYWCYRWAIREVDRAIPEE
jgi:hypothetical protein